MAESTPKRGRGRPSVEEAERSVLVSIRLPADVAAALKATGPGWTARAADILRAAVIGGTP